MLRAVLHEYEIRRVIGAPEGGCLVVDGIAKLDAGEDRCLYFIEGNIGETMLESFAACEGCIIIARHGLSLPPALEKCLVLRVTEPRAAIAKVLGFIRNQHRQIPLVEAREISQDAAISPMAVLEGNVKIEEGVVIEPFCTIGPEVMIGRGSILRAGAHIYPRVSIGEASVIGSNAVIGSDGYGFVRDETGNKARIPHLGGVMIGSHVEVGALCCVQSGTISPTIIEDQVKIDDHVQIGHNVRIAQGASIVGGVCIGGSAVVGAEAWIGMNSSVKNGVQVGPNALVGMDVSIQEELAENTVARAPRPDVRVRYGGDRAAIGFKTRERTVF